MYDWVASTDEDVKMESNMGDYSNSELAQHVFDIQTHEAHIKNDPDADPSHQQSVQAYGPMFQDVQLDSSTDVQIPDFNPVSFGAFIDSFVKPELEATQPTGPNMEPGRFHFVPPPHVQRLSASNEANTYGTAKLRPLLISQIDVNPNPSTNGYRETLQVQAIPMENDIVEYNTLADDTNGMDTVQYDGSSPQSDRQSSEPGVSYAVNGHLPPVPEPEGFVNQPLCRIKTFYVGGAWPMGASYDTAKHRFGQMYVEQMDPQRILQPHAIVFLHGDFHHGKIWQTKPDEDPGWASFFLQKGYQVFIVDLPPSGRSNFLTPMNYKRVDIERVSQAFTAADVERTLTIPEAVAQYPSAELHSQWPGTGRRGDEVFDAHCDSLDTLTVPKRERQNLGQHAMAELLKKMDRKAVLIGEGARSNIAWLTADVVPERVAAVVAVEPAGPPFGKPARLPNGAYTGSVHREHSVRAYGLTDIPLTYDPPARAPESIISLDSQDVLDVVEVARDGTRAVYFMQDGADTSGRTIIRNAIYPSEIKGRVRQLVQLKRVPHAVITGEAGAHTEFDWATVAFMRQAGLDVNWIKLEEHGIKGNGHLMFLEKNSDKIAGLVELWIRNKTQPTLATDRSQIVNQYTTATMTTDGDQYGVTTLNHHLYPVQNRRPPDAIDEEISRILNAAANGTAYEPSIGLPNGATSGMVNSAPTQNQDRHTVQSSEGAIDKTSMMRQHTQPHASTMNASANGVQVQHQYVPQNTNGLALNNTMQHHHMGPNATNVHHFDPYRATRIINQQLYSTSGAYGNDTAAFST